MDGSSDNGIRPAVAAVVEAGDAVTAQHAGDQLVLAADAIALPDVLARIYVT